MKKSVVVLVCLIATLCSPPPARATHFSDIVRGRILLDVEQNGEAWYVYPPSLERHYLGRPADAFAIMSELGLGISNADLERIPTGQEPGEGDLALRERVSGRILLQVEENGEAWYVYPVNTRRYFLGRPADAFEIMNNLGLGITSANLAHIPIAGESLATTNGDAHALRDFTLTNDRGSFPVHVISLRRDRFEMITDTAESQDCASNCDALELKDYVDEHGAFAAIHGTYFCPPDYSACDKKTNTFLPPVFNTGLDRLINEDTLRFHNRPMIASDTNGELYYFHRSSAFGDSVADFEDAKQTELQAAIGNWPSLVENGFSVVANEPSESGFLVPATRGGIGWNDDHVFLVIAGGATMDDFASIFLSLGADDAMNLDGGGSATLYYDGAYRFGPGRDLPNAILFQEK